MTPPTEPERHRLRVLLCEPYFTGSHRAWAEGLARHSAHDVELVTHSGSSWRWRMQGGALTLATAVERSVARSGRPDVLVVSDMVHVPALLGLARHVLVGVPVVVYLHENQLTYPLPDGATPDHTYAMTNWLSVAAADRVVCNSEYHLEALFDALPAFLRRFPDQRHDRLVAQVRARSEVLPVGIQPGRFHLGRPAGDGTAVPTVLWNHRWEYDKDPAAFFAALDAVAAEGVGFHAAVAGTAAGPVPPAMDHGRRRLGDRVVHFGTADEPTYLQLLAGSDVVVSTARHEFFGLAVAEAVAAGALPLLPDRLAYPELVPAPEPYLYRTADDLVGRLRWALTDHAGRSAAAERARTHVARFSWEAVAPRYDELFERVVAAGPLTA